MARPSNTDQRRHEIALALGSVMGRVGYDGASTNAIAAEAGVAAGGIHYHYTSKEEILEELIGLVVAGVRERIEARTAAAKGPRGRLHAIVDGLLGLGEDSDQDAVAVWDAIGAEATRNPSVGASYLAWTRKVRSELSRAYSDACRQEGRSTTGARDAATALLAQVEGSIRLGVGAPGVIPRGSASARVRRVADVLLDQQPRT